MKRAEKFSEIVDDLNQAKDRIYSVVEELESEGFSRDAEQLMKMVYRIEAFQNKHNTSSLYR